MPKSQYKWIQTVLNFQKKSAAPLKRPHGWNNFLEEGRLQTVAYMKRFGQYCCRIALIFGVILFFGRISIIYYSIYQKHIWDGPRANTDGLNYIRIAQWIRTFKRSILPDHYWSVDPCIIPFTNDRSHCVHSLFFGRLCCIRLHKINKTGQMDDTIYSLSLHFSFRCIRRLFFCSRSGLYFSWKKCPFRVVKVSQCHPAWWYCLR